MRAKLCGLQSIPQVVADMTLEEKLDMVGCYRACHTRPIPDMDVPAIYLMDGATGLNGSHVVLDYLTDPCRADDPRTAYATPEMIALNRVDLKQAAKARVSMCISAASRATTTSSMPGSSSVTSILSYPPR